MMMSAPDSRYASWTSWHRSGRMMAAVFPWTFFVSLIMSLTNRFVLGSLPNLGTVAAGVASQGLRARLRGIEEGAGDQHGRTAEQAVCCA